ncbi:MAG: hypothetical protein JNL88_12300 [Bacteroidia bacterium]|nr:hypothetical protein [Bacteroidia bacterium]
MKILLCFPFRTFLTPVLLLLSVHFSSGQHNGAPGDSMIRQIRIQYSGSEFRPDSLEREFIRKNNNELFRALRIEVLQAEEKAVRSAAQELSRRRLREVRSVLMEEGVPEKIISGRIMPAADALRQHQLRSSSLLIRYELPKDYYAVNSQPGMPTDSLCLKDTLIALRPGMLLREPLCSLLNRSALPEIHTVEARQGEAGTTEPPPVILNRKGWKTLTMFHYRPANGTVTPDELLIPLSGGGAGTEWIMEYYEDSLRMWLLLKNAGKKKLRIASADYYPVTLPREGYYRLSSLPRSAMQVLYLSAPPHLSFQKAELVSAESQCWSAQIINGGTVALFIVPVDVMELTGRFSMIDAGGQVLHTAESPLQRQLGKRYRIPESMRGKVEVDGRMYSIPEHGYSLHDDFDTVDAVYLDQIK